MYNCNYLLYYIYNHYFMSQLFPKLYDFTMLIFLVEYMNLSVCLCVCVFTHVLVELCFVCVCLLTSWLSSASCVCVYSRLG